MSESEVKNISVNSEIKGKIMAVYANFLTSGW